MANEKEPAMSDFLSFDTFITPKIIRIVFALGLLLIALSHADPRALGHLAAQLCSPASSCR